MYIQHAKIYVLGGKYIAIVPSVPHYSLSTWWPLIILASLVTLVTSESSASESTPSSTSERLNNASEIHT